MATEQRPRRARGGGRIPDADIEQAQLQIERAFSLLGLVGAGGNPVCPDCGEDRKGKVKLLASKGRFKCYSGDHFGYAVNLMQDHGGYSFRDAVSALLGRPVSARAAVKLPEKLVAVRSAPDFTAEPDPELYAWIARHGDRDAAASYFAAWHIAPAAVREVGAFYLPLKRQELRALHIKAVDEFGRDRLIAAGVAQPMDPDKVRPARNADDAKVHDLYFAGMPPGYPVGEPHVTAEGTITYCQFRPDGKAKAAVDAHKAGKKAKKRAEAAGETYTATVPPYKPPFLSLRGASHAAMLGGGVWRLARLEPGCTIVVVEGLKDLMAARTMGAEAYAIPGAQTLPPPQVCELLARHKVLVALDGDEAGDEARQQVIDHLQANGVKSVGPKQMPAGMDVTDILVDRHARAGCTCPTCAAWRADRDLGPDEQAQAS